VVDRGQRTSVEGVYAAGDITGGVRQIVTACAEGAVAALSSTEVLGKKYPY
ncbi:MAG TPA: thioredoxin-disulfide reductase, partial [Thermoplasmatales archaeon]|nr:thioredoxin-disulfide reductase [Thermoplasmatales archaeon]